MIIQATPYGTKKEEPYAFTYSGDFTDSRVDGIGDVTLNTSGTLVTTGKAVTVSVYILAGGGGASHVLSSKGTGGGGGNQTIDVELVPGTYEIIIGTGGAADNSSCGNDGGTGGSTSAFGKTSTGGGGATGIIAYSPVGGKGGTPNGNPGTGIVASTSTISGGSPNGGSIVNGVAQPGGDGLVRITFS